MKTKYVVNYVCYLPPDFKTLSKQFSDKYEAFDSLRSMQAYNFAMKNDKMTDELQDFGESYIPKDSSNSYFISAEVLCMCIETMYEEKFE